MKKQDLIDTLQHIIDTYPDGAKVKLVSLIKDVKDEPIRNDNYKNKFKQIHINSQKWMILNYLQNHSLENVTWSDFIKTWIFTQTPFIWYSAGARLSELLRVWLVDKAWIKKWLITFFNKSSDRTLYTVSMKWLSYKIRWK